MIEKIFQQYEFNKLILCGPTLGRDHRSHSPWYQRVKAWEVGRGEGTPVESIIFAYIMFVPL